MFRSKPTTTQRERQMLLNKLYEMMTDPNTPLTIEEFAKISAEYQALYKLDEFDTKSNAHKHVSTEALATIGANLAGILLIVGHERAHVITSKALPLVKNLFK